MRVSSVAEHEAFTRLFHHLHLVIEELRNIAGLREDQPWNQVVGLMEMVKDKIFDLAERGLKQ